MRAPSIWHLLKCSGIWLTPVASDFKTSRPSKSKEEMQRTFTISGLPTFQNYWNVPYVQPPWRKKTSARKSAAQRPSWSNCAAFFPGICRRAGRPQIHGFLTVFQLHRGFGGRSLIFRNPVSQLKLETKQISSWKMVVHYGGTCHKLPFIPNSTSSFKHTPLRWLQESSNLQMNPFPTGFWGPSSWDQPW